jgi:hypothetical protein
MKNNCTPLALRLPVPRNVNRIADLHVDSYTGVLLLECAILADLAVKRQRHADLMPTITQRAGNASMTSTSAPPVASAAPPRCSSEFSFVFDVHVGSRVFLTLLA